jgi:hypothetical protein
LKEAKEEVAGFSTKAGRFEKAATPEDQNSRGRNEFRMRESIAGPTDVLVAECRTYAD